MAFLKGRTKVIDRDISKLMKKIPRLIKLVQGQNSAE